MDGLPLERFLVKSYYLTNNLTDVVNDNGRLWKFIWYLEVHNFGETQIFGGD